MSIIVVELSRGSLVENVYRGDGAVIDASGRPLFHIGEAGKVTYWRSAAKPFQAMPVVRSGAAHAYGFGPEHLAILCSSHNSEDVHVQAVCQVFERAGLTLSLLQCGTHLPFDRQTAESMVRAGRSPEPVHNNCSGKHAGMLALAQYLGVPLHLYTDPQSDVQRAILAAIAAITGLSAERIVVGIDGCGVPVFGTPLFHMALAFARLADPQAMPSGYEEAGRQIRDAMVQFPYHVAGRRRICTEIISLPGKRFVAKSGADGVYCVGILPEAVRASKVLQRSGAQGGVGIAVKAEDGDKDVRHMMTVEILRQLDVLTHEDVCTLSRYRSELVRNHAGLVVGEKKTVFRLDETNPSR